MTWRTSSPVLSVAKQTMKMCFSCAMVAMRLRTYTALGWKRYPQGRGTVLYVSLSGLSVLHQRSPQGPFVQANDVLVVRGLNSDGCKHTATSTRSIGLEYGNRYGII